MDISAAKIIRHLQLAAGLLALIHSTTSLADKTLVFNITSNPPLNTPQQTGFMDRISTEALHRIGYRLETVKLPAERGLKNTNAGIEDGEMSRIRGLEKLYPNLIRVPEKIMDWEFLVFSRQKIDLDQGWNSLANRYVAYINGWKILENNIPTSAHVTRVRTAEQLFTLLRKKRIDHIIYEHWSGIHYLRQYGLKNITIGQPPLAKREMFIYLHKRHRTLVPQLARALRDMKKDGSYQRIWRRTLSEDDPDMDRAE